MAMSRQTIVGVFDEPAMADNAINALQEAGFSADQIYYSAHATANGGGGGFLEGLRRLFTDNETGAAGAGHVSHDLEGFGLSGDEADYYDREYQAGHGVVAVRAGGRDQEALNILQTNGAHSYTSGSAAAGGRSYDPNDTTAGTGYDTVNTANYGTTNTATDTTTTTTGVDRDRDYNGDAKRAGYATDATGVGATTDYNANTTTGTTDYDRTNATTTGTTGYDTNATTTDYDRTNATTTGTTDYDRTNATTTGTTGYDTNATTTDYDRTNATTTGTTDYDTANAGTYNTGNAAYDTGSDVDTDEQRRLRLREERLNVDKDRVQTGQVGLHKEVVEEQKNIDVPVTHEEVYVERRPVTDGAVNEAPIGEGETINVPVSQEQVNVSKDTVTTGEVGLGKRTVEGTQRVSDTVRREEARVDQQGDVPIQDRTNSSYTTDRTDTTDTTDR